MYERILTCEADNDIHKIWKGKESADWTKDGSRKGENDGEREKGRKREVVEKSQTLLYSFSLYGSYSWISDKKSCYLVYLSRKLVLTHSIFFSPTSKNNGCRSLARNILRVENIYWYKTKHRKLDALDSLTQRYIGQINYWMDGCQSVYLDDRVCLSLRVFFFFSFCFVLFCVSFFVRKRSWLNSL